MQRRAVPVLFAALLALAVANAAPAATAAGAAFAIESQSARLIPGTCEVRFTITFTRPPDFFTVDEAGRPANSFQYLIGDPSAGYDAVIRGDEIRLVPGHLRIRGSAPSDPDPAAGGWGAVHGTVPYKAHGRVKLTFVVPLDRLGVRPEADALTYELETYVFGAATGFGGGTIPLRPGC